jgi:hypothetical protein
MKREGFPQRDMGGMIERTFAPCTRSIPTIEHEISSDSDAFSGFVRPTSAARLFLAFPVGFYSDLLSSERQALAPEPIGFSDHRPPSSCKRMIYAFSFHTRGNLSADQLKRPIVHDREIDMVIVNGRYDARICVLSPVGSGAKSGDLKAMRSSTCDPLAVSQKQHQSN